MGFKNRTFVRVGGTAVKKIYDPAAVAAYLSQSRHRAVLEGLGIPLFAVQYAPGELVTTPYADETLFQVVAQGALTIYFIRDDGARYALSSGEKDYILGDMDLFCAAGGSVYTEAAGPLVCLALSIDANRQALLQDNRFLRLLCSSLSAKIGAIAALDAAPASLAERVLVYMQYKCEDGVLKGVEKAAFHLHCSARQLQRILTRCAQEGRVRKIGKGPYRLTRPL